MKRHGNTLYVTTQGTYLAVEGETVSARVEGESRMRVPLHMLAGIVCFGRVSMSPQLMGKCSECGIGISFLSERGRFLASVRGPVSGNVLLRREQYRRADDPRRSMELARAFVLSKVANCRTVIQRVLRDRGNNEPELRAAVLNLASSLESLRKATSLDSVRGIEGEAGKTYFGVFNRLITIPETEFRFARRSRRPPTDAVNALLSFLYTLLLHDTRSSLEAVGLDPQVGFLHRDRPGRPGLALDLMEEFRPVLADRLTLSLINRRQVQPSGFETRETGAVLMDDGTRKTVLRAYQERKNEEIKHPFLEEKTTTGMLVHLQSMLLARHLRSDLDGYPPFFWK